MKLTFQMEKKMIEININKVVDALIEMGKFMRTDYKTTWGKNIPMSLLQVNLHGKKWRIN